MAGLQDGVEYRQFKLRRAAVRAALRPACSLRRVHARLLLQPPCAALARRWS